MQFIGGDAVGVDSRDFYECYLGKKPCILKRHPQFGIDIESAFRAVELAILAGDVRIYDETYRRALREKRKRAESATACSSLSITRERFECGDTVAIQYFEKYNEDVARNCNDLSVELNTYVHATAFISPSASKGTDMHWDQMDVFACQLDGQKKWRLYWPQQHLPNRRVPTPVGDMVNSEQLIQYQDYLLSPGDILYVPRGWIHDVQNDGETPSIHVSLVVFVDSVLTILANAVNAAFVQCRQDPQWRDAINLLSLGSDPVVKRLDCIRNQFLDNFSSQFAGDVSRHLDHIPFGSAERQIQESARASMQAHVASNAFILIRTNLVPLCREREDGACVCISTDGLRFFDLDRSIWLYIQNRGAIDLCDSAVQSLFEENDWVRAVEVLVAKVGLFRIAAPQPLRSRSPIDATKGDASVDVALV